MISYQNLKTLQSLYHASILGVRYVDDISFSHNAYEPQENLEIPSTFHELQKIVHNCHLCDLCKSRKIAQAGYGSDQARLMIIADMPTIAENNEGAYSGKSGKKLEEMLNFIGLQKEDIYYTHHVKCLPLPGKQPTHQEILTCKPFVQREIELVQPKLIVTLGQLSYNYLTGDSTAYHTVAGELQTYHGYMHMSIYSPTFLLRNPSYEEQMVTYMKKIEQFLCA